MTYEIVISNRKECNLFKELLQKWLILNHIHDQVYMLLWLELLPFGIHGKNNGIPPPHYQMLNALKRHSRSSQDFLGKRLFLPPPPPSSMLRNEL